MYYEHILDCTTVFQTTELRKISIVIVTIFLEIECKYIISYLP